MRTHPLRRSTLLAAAVILSALGSALAAQSHGASPAGAWKMHINFADGARAAGLELKLDGRKVTGKFVASFAGDIAIEGELASGTLTFSGITTDGPHPGIQLDFTATAKEDGTLEGSISAPFGEFKWTAERLKPSSAHSPQSTVVAGTWTLAIQGGDHVVPMGLVIEQDGKKLTGSLMAQGKEVPFEGEFVDGHFWLTPTVKAEVHDQSGHGHALKLTGALLEDGTLKGEMPGPKGAIPWTAERLKKRK